MKRSFNELFNINNDGSLTPKQVVIIGGVRLSPGVTFNKGTLFSGIELHSLKGRYLEVEDNNGTPVIVGIYYQNATAD